MKQGGRAGKPRGPWVRGEVKQRGGIREGSAPKAKRIGREVRPVPRGAGRTLSSRPRERAGSGITKWQSNRLRPDRISIMESLILAQNERWRRVLSMQVGRDGGAIPPEAADW